VLLELAVRSATKHPTFDATMAPTQPTLPKKKAPAKKAAPTGKELPIAFAQHITLEDGTQVGTPAPGAPLGKA
jgi:hypothetical protein